MIKIENSIDQVNIKISSEANSASSNLDKLSNSIANLELKLESALKKADNFVSSIKNISKITFGKNNKNSPFDNAQKSISSMNQTAKKNNLSSLMKALNQIPDISNKLDDKEISTFTKKINQLTEALKPLSTELVKVSSSFALLPSNLNKVNTALNSAKKSIDTTKSSTGNSLLSNLFSGLKFGALTAGIYKVTNSLGQFVNKSNEYIENMNLFSVSMGEATEKAEEFIDKYTEALGIDPSNVMRYMGMFNTLVEGFGVSSDAAYTMSKNLTQLSYDMSSFLNIPVEDAMQKLKSGISGEIEPMRAVGIALDEATLQETAYTLGIDQKVSAMTRAQKSELLYYQIMTRTSKMQGDMARTLLSPANALRVLQQQFTQLARAIGNIFLPIISALLPYIMLVTKALTALANTIANFFGFTLPSIDYSNVTDGLGGISSDIGDIGTSAGKTNKQLNKMLQNFDDLNVINFDTDTGTGGGSGSGTGAGVGGSLGIPLPDYDPLTGLAQEELDKIMKQIDEFVGKIKDLWNNVSPILQKFEPLLKGIGAMFITAFAWDWIVKFLSKFKTLTKTVTILKSIVGAVKLAITAFLTATTTTGGFSAAISSLWASFKGYMSALTPMQKVKVTLVAMVGVFVTVYNAVKDFTKGSSDLGTVLLNITPIIAAVGTAMYAMLGPVGLVITAVTALVAGIAAYEKAQKEMADDRALARMFDGQGQSMQAVIDYYSRLNDATSKYTSTIINASEDIDSNNEKFDETAVSIENLASQMTSLFYSATDEDFDNMNNNFQELGDIAQQNLAKMVSGVITNINQIKELGQIDDENAQKMIDNAIKVQQAQGNKVADLEYQITRLNSSYRDGSISQEEYRKKVAELLKEMAKLNDGVSEAESKYASFSKNMNSTTLKINLESPEKAKEYIEELASIYDEQVQNIKDSNSQIENYYDNLIAQAEGDTELVKSLEEDKTTMMKENQKYLEQIQGDYKGTWLTIRAELAASGADTADDMQEVVDLINSNLGDLGDIDVSGKGKTTIDGYFQEILTSKDNGLPRAIAALKDAGYNMSDALVEGATLTEVEQQILNNNWSKASQIDASTKKEMIEQLQQDGYDIKDAYGNSIEFTEDEKKIINQMLTSPWTVKAEDKAKLLKRIVELGAEIKDAEGNAVEFTEEEKNTIINDMNAPFLSWTENVLLMRTTTDFTNTIMNNMIENIYNKAYNAEDAGKTVADSAGDAIVSSFTAKAPTINNASEKLITDDVNKAMNDNVDTKGVGDEAIKQAKNQMWDLRRTLEKTAKDVANDMGDSFSDNLTVNNKTFKSSLNSVFSTTIRKLKSNNSVLFDAIGLVIPAFNWFAEGGFPETGEMFIAREAGPELVGSIGNRAAVANNDQIIEGIKQGTYEAVSTAMRENNNSRQPVIVKIGEKTIYSGYGSYVDSQSNMYGSNYIRT